jgi:hypothetical protein
MNTEKTGSAGLLYVRPIAGLCVTPRFRVIPLVFKKKNVTKTPGSGLPHDRSGSTYG